MYRSHIAQNRRYVSCVGIRENSKLELSWTWALLGRFVCDTCSLMSLIYHTLKNISFELLCISGTLLCWNNFCSQPRRHLMANWRVLNEIIQWIFFDQVATLTLTIGLGILLLLENMQLIKTDVFKNSFLGFDDSSLSGMLHIFISDSIYSKPMQSVSDVAINTSCARKTTNDDELI